MPSTGSSTSRTPSTVPSTPRDAEHGHDPSTGTSAACAQHDRRARDARGSEHGCGAGHAGRDAVRRPRPETPARRARAARDRETRVMRRTQAAPRGRPAFVPSAATDLTRSCMLAWVPPEYLGPMIRSRSIAPKLDELARLVARQAPGSDRERRFAVRSFAGPTAYCGVLDDVKIAHLTDQPRRPRDADGRAARRGELTNAGKPDLVVLTGDFVCHSQDVSRRARRRRVAASRRPRSRCSATTITGPAPTRCAARSRARASRCSTTRTRRSRCAHQTLQVVGLDDAYTGHADRERGGEGPAARPADDRSLAHRRGGRRALGARRAARALGPHARRAGRRSRGCTSSRSASSPGTSTCTDSTARGPRRRPRARCTWARASAPRSSRSASASAVVARSRSSSSARLQGRGPSTIRRSRRCRGVPRPKRRSSVVPRPS